VRKCGARKGWEVLRTAQDAALVPFHGRTRGEVGLPSEIGASSFGEREERQAASARRSREEGMATSPSAVHVAESWLC